MAAGEDLAEGGEVFLGRRAPRAEVGTSVAWEVGPRGPEQ